MTTGITDDFERDKDEPLSSEDLAAIESLVLYSVPNDLEYDDGPGGDIEDDEDGIVENDDDDDPDAELDDDPLFTENVDYGEQEDL